MLRVTMVQRRRTITYRPGVGISFRNASGFPVTVIDQFKSLNGGTLLMAASRIELPSPLRPVGRLLRPVLRAITGRLPKRPKWVLETRA